MRIEVFQAKEILEGLFQVKVIRNILKTGTGNLKST